MTAETRCGVRRREEVRWGARSEEGCWGGVRHGCCCSPIDDQGVRQRAQADPSLLGCGVEPFGSASHLWASPERVMEWTEWRVLVMGKGRWTVVGRAACAGPPDGWGDPTGAARRDTGALPDVAGLGESIEASEGCLRLRQPRVFGDTAIGLGQLGWFNSRLASRPGGGRVAPVDP